MPDSQTYQTIDLTQLDRIRQTERPPLHIRWWVLPLAALLCAAQAILCMVYEHIGPKHYITSTLIPLIAFGFLAIVALGINPLLRLVRLIQPFNRGELMSLFAAMAVTAGISTFGLVDQLVPIIAGPYNPDWNKPQRKWDKDVLPHLRQDLFITDTEKIKEFRWGFDVFQSSPERIREKSRVPDRFAQAPGWLQPTILWLARVDILARQIPWRTWARPVALWMIFIFGMYALFYSASMLLYDSWARREKLVFPLARLPEDLMHDDGSPPGSMPSTLKTPLFWIGLLAVFLLMTFNIACAAGWIRGMSAISLGMNQNQLVSMLKGTIFDGIADNAQFRLIFLVSFTGLGIGFLLPLDISRSLWMYFVGALAALMVAIWCAFGSSVKSFPSDWQWENNFVSSLGAGGLLAFAAACFGKLLVERWAQTGERAEGGGRFAAFLLSFGWGGVGLALSLAVVVGWLAWSGVALPWGLLFVAIVMLIAIGLMRVTAEGGVYWYQIHVSPFHMVKMTGGAAPTAEAVAAAGAKGESLAGGLVPVKVVAVLMPVYAILFLDIKTYIAPNILNSFKMQEETRASRRMFHATVLVSILVTVVVCVGFLLFLVYDIGANKAARWFFTGLPTNVFDQTQRLIGGQLAETGRYNWIFYLCGAAWVFLSLAMRRRVFWWLHPIGFAMLANPLMSQLWFGFFLGWFCKRIAVKYGGRHMFARIRPLFVGLIFGEWSAIFIWTLYSQIVNDPNIVVTLNRYSP